MSQEHQKDSDDRAPAPDALLREATPATGNTAVLSPGTSGLMSQVTGAVFGRFKPILGIQWKAATVDEDLLSRKLASIRETRGRRGVTLFMWLLTAVLFLLVTEPTMAIVRTGGIPEPMAAELLQTLALLFQIDKLWLHIRSLKEDRTSVRHAFLASGTTTVFAVLASIKLAVALYFAVSRLCDGIETLLNGVSAAEKSEIRRSVGDEIRAAGGVWPWAKKFQLGGMWPRKLRYWLLIAAVLLAMLCETGLDLYAPSVDGAFMRTLEQVLTEEDLVPARGVLGRVLVPLAFQIAFRAVRKDWLPRVRQVLWKGYSLDREQHIRRHIFAFLMDHDAAFHDTVNQADMAAAPTMALKIPKLIGFLIFDTVPEFITLVVAAVAVWSRYGPYVTLVLACVVTLNSLIIYHADRKLGPVYDRRADVERKAERQEVGGLRAWKTAVLFGQVEREIDDYEASQMARNQARWRCHSLYEAFTSISEVIVSVGYYVAKALVILRALDNGSTLSAVVAFDGYWTLLQSPLLSLMRLPGRIHEDLRSTDPLRQLLQRERTMVYGTGDRRITEGKVRFEKATFAHANAGSKSVPVFRGLKLAINAGTMTAIVGPSGAGKTTLLELIRRFYDLDEGCVEIDGTNVRAFTKEMLARGIAVMQQDPYLLDKTIMENIRYGSDASSAEVHEAAKKVGIHDDIMSRDGQYEAMVGENGRNLSGGQKQRIALARILLRQPRPSLLLFDEATSALDAKSEALVRNSIKSEFSGMTIVYVTHRLSSIKDADKIVVLGKDQDGCGTIVEEGTHDELVAKAGAYAEFLGKLGKDRKLRESEK